LKANANKNKFNIKKMRKSTLAYIEELDKAVEKDRKRHDKKALKPKDPIDDTKETRVSTTDPESGFMVRDGKLQGVLLPRSRNSRWKTQYDHRCLCHTRQRP
jgi:hypothetical protein